MGAVKLQRLALALRPPAVVGGEDNKTKEFISGRSVRNKQANNKQASAHTIVRREK